MNISKTSGEHFEIRLIVWRARAIPNMDELTQASDLFFTATLRTKDDCGRAELTMLETDTHWRARGDHMRCPWHFNALAALPSVCLHIRNTVPFPGLSFQAQEISTIG